MTTARDAARAGWEAAPVVGLPRAAAAIITLVAGSILAGILERMADRLAQEANRGLNQSDDGHDIG